MQKPRPLQLGDFIGILSPSGPVSHERLMEGIRRLQSWGFRTLLGTSVFAARGYLAGSDVERAADFNIIWSNPDVAGVICARGGYGAMRILDYIDWEMVKARPKFFCGFSDVTALHVAMQQRANLVTFHGPMVGAFGEGAAYNAAGLQAALRRAQPLGAVPWPDLSEDAPLRYTIREGTAEGVLAGGNLSLLCSLMGTPYEPDFDGKLLLLEEVDEEPYRVDRMLTQLLLAGKLKRVRGIIFGDSPTCMFAPEGKPSFTLLEMLEERLAPLGVPAIYGFPCGHGVYRATIPLGVRARLDAGACTLTILEAALSHLNH